MKKITILFLSLLTLASCSKNESNTNLHLSGTIDGLKKGTLYVQRIQDSSFVTIDSIIIDGDSKFESHLNIETPEMLYLFLDKGTSNSLDNNISFFAEPGAINIDTNLDRFIFDAKITGSKNQDKYNEFKKVNIRFRDENLDLIKAQIHAMRFKNQKALDSVTAKQEKNKKRKYLYTTNFAMTNNDYEVTPYIVLSEIADINIKFLDTIQQSMTPKVAKSLYGKQLTEYVKEIKGIK